MTPCKNLERLFSSTRGRLRQLRAAWARELAAREVETAFVVIELQSTWANFMRAFFISCAFGARTGSGTPSRLELAPVLSENDAIGLAIKTKKPTARPKSSGAWDRRDEPKWYEVQTVLSILQKQKLSTLEDVQAAFSTGDRTFEDLPTVRNYFAHRSWQTELAARAVGRHYGIPATLRPTQILGSRPIGRPRPLLAEWIDHVEFTAEFLCV